MERLIKIPVDNDSLEAVERMLHCRDVFTSGFGNHMFNQYEVAAYLKEHYMHGIQFVFRYDRNIMSRLMELMQAKSLTYEHRIASGIQMFAQVSEAVIEPNIGFYELASGLSFHDAQREIAMFRRLDNTHPQIFANIATGLYKKLNNVEIGEGVVGPEERANFTAKLRRWQASYSVCLKIATLELTHSVAEEKMFELFRWFEEFYFIAPGIILANRYFAPYAIRKGLFKGLRSKNRVKALNGIRNAAWDLTLIYAWVDDVCAMHSTGRYVILASLDKALHSIARSMLDVGNDESQANVVRERLMENEFFTTWGPKRGKRIMDAYLGALERLDTHPEKRSELTIECTKEVIKKLEEIIRNFNP